MKKYDVVALGELLIDFTQNGLSPQGNPMFEANPGGAPANVLAMLKKLGCSVGYIGKVGDDGFGHQLEKALLETDIGTEGLSFDKEVHTTLAIVQTMEDGDRDFSFYRKPGADIMLTKDEVPAEMVEECKIFHFGTLSMTDEGVREATKYAVEKAENAGAVISFDPNIRMPLWDSEDCLKEQIAYGMSHCNVLKISDDEITYLTGIEDYTEAVAALRKTYDIPLILVSMGKAGSRAYYKDIVTEVTPFLMPNTIETTGAGDTFMACMLYGVLNNGLTDLTEETLQEMLQFANAAAALITTKKGALRVMPERADVEALIREKKENKA